MWIPCYFDWSSKPRPKAEIDDGPLSAYSTRCPEKSQTDKALRTKAADLDATIFQLLQPLQSCCCWPEALAKFSL